MSCPERGHVLLAFLLLLAVVGELGQAAWRLAAGEGLAAREAERRLQTAWRLQSMVSALERLPVPATTDDRGPWHPLAPVNDAMGACAPSASWLGISRDCMTTSPGWRWQLIRLADPADGQEEGTDPNAWPGRQVQHWQLDVLPGGGLAGWRLDYHQQASP